MQPVSSYQTYVDYFREIAIGATKHKDISSFKLGDSKRLIAAKRSELDYPCLWMENPSGYLDDNGAGNTEANMQGAFTIIENAAEDDYERQDEVMQETWQIAVDIIARMYRDKTTDPRLINIDLKTISLEPISTLMMDNSYGWRVEFRISNSIDICFNPGKWQ